MDDINRKKYIGYNKMPNIIVRIYLGVKAQIPEDYEVNAATYQDVVTAIINSGKQSGSIYGVNGEIIDYNSPVTLAEVNYIIPNGGTSPTAVAFNGVRIQIQYNVKGTFRDIYNLLVAQGLPRNGNIVYSGHYIDLDERVPDDLSKGNLISYLPARETPVEVTRSIFVVANGVTYDVTYNPSGTFRGIYDQLIVKGLPPNGQLIYAGAVLDPNAPISSRNLGLVNQLYYNFPRTETVPEPSMRIGQSVNLRVRTPNQGETTVLVTTGVTKASDVVLALNPIASNMKLALVNRGAYTPYIYQDNERIYQPNDNEHLFLVPDYETLFAGYSAMI